MIQVDARGLDCPKPVIETKKAMDSGADRVTTLVDNETAAKNVALLAGKMGFSVVRKVDGGAIALEMESLEQTGSDAPPRTAGAETGDWTLLMAQDTLGEGSRELGAILAKGYFYALTETKPYPKAALFLNGGIRLALKGSPVLEHIRTLEAGGTEILVCGTCLDFFGEKENLGVGSVSNMYDIVDRMKEAPRLIRP